MFADHQGFTLSPYCSDEEVYSSVFQYTVTSLFDVVRDTTQHTFLPHLTILMLVVSKGAALLKLSTKEGSKILLFNLIFNYSLSITCERLSVIAIPGVTIIHVHH